MGLGDILAHSVEVKIQRTLNALFGYAVQASITLAWPILSRGSADNVDWCHLLQISDSVRVGRSRQERLYIVGGPSQSKESRVDVVAIATEPNWTLNAHSTVDNSQNYRFRLSLAWRSSSNGDRRCPSHLSHQCRSNVRERSLYSMSDSHVACPHRGRKRLSREATLRTLLALEWPELVQIGRCKVRWLPSAASKRNLTSFYSEKIIYTTCTRSIRAVCLPCEIQSVQKIWPGSLMFIYSRCTFPLGLWTMGSSETRTIRSAG